MVAIGDVQPSDVKALAGTGIDGVAMVRAFSEAHNQGSEQVKSLAGQIIADFDAGRAGVCA